MLPDSGRCKLQTIIQFFYNLSKNNFFNIVGFKHSKYYLLGILHIDKSGNIITFIYSFPQCLSSNTCFHLLITALKVKIL